MPLTSKTFRIFVSSTFSDLKEERNALQRYVFPRLRELCMQHGCRFQAIDLRWGVSEEAALDQQTMKICLEEIKRCRKTTPRPNFIVLLGDRYGWQPLPFEIPASEFEQIESLIAEQRDRDLLAHWYRRDDNADPAVYCLQPRELDLSDAETDEQKHAARELEFVEWSEIEAELRRILLAAVDRLSLNQEQRLRYEASATEQEIEAGALSVKDAHEHVFCFFRSIRSLPTDESARDFVDLKENGERFELDSDAHARQNALREDRLRVKLPNNIFDYETEWKRTTEVDSTASTRCKNVIDAIANRLAELTREQHGIQLTVEALENLRETKVSALQQTVNAPQDEAEEIESPISVAHIPELCADVFLSLARVMLEEIARIEEAEPLDKEIESHKDFGEDRARFFVGRQTYLKRISQYLQNEAAHPLALHGESGSGKSALMARAVADATKEHSPSAVIVHRFIGATPSSSDGWALLESLCKEITKHYGEDEQSVPTEYQKLVKDFQKRLELATQDKPLIVFLDALDQLSDNEHARNLAWLPNKLPPHVHVIVSTLPGECLSQLERKLPAENLLKLDPMTSSEGDELLDSWLADANRQLSHEQRESVLKEFRENGLPLYLKLAFEEARRWKSYSHAQNFPPDIPGMIREMFRRLMSDHSQMLIDRALGYIAAARHGLSEDELVDVLSMDKEVFDDFLERAHHTPPGQRLPVVVWSRLYFDLEPYITERSADGANLLGFYHRQLGEVVTEEFLAGDAKRERHSGLARYFRDQPLQIENEGRETPNIRKLSELPYQQTRGKMWNELEQTLIDLCFAEAKCVAGMLFDLLRDCDRAMRAEDSTAIAQVRRAVALALPSLSKRPALALQIMYNRLRWFDALTPELRTSLEAARSRLDEQPFWIIAEAPLPGAQTASNLSIPFGFDAYLQALSLNGQAIAISSFAGDVEIRELLSGDSIGTRSLDADHIVAIALSEDAASLAWKDATGAIYSDLTDVSFPGRKKDELLAYHSAVGVVGVRQDHALVAWRPEHGRTFVLAPNLPEPLLALRVSRDARTVFFIAGDKEQMAGLATWTGDSWMTRMLPQANEPIVDADMDPEAKRVVLASRRRGLRVLELETGARSASLDYERREDVIITGAMEQCAWGCGDSSDWVFFSTQDGQLAAWNWRENAVERLEDYRTRFEHQSLILFGVLPPEGQLFISTNLQGKLLTRQSRRTVSTRHEAEVSECFITASHQIVSLSQHDQTVRWFSVDGLKPLFEQVHKGPRTIAACGDSDDVLIGTQQGFISRQVPGSQVSFRNVFKGFSEPVVSLFDAGEGYVLAAGKSAKALRIHLPTRRQKVLWHSSGRQTQERILPAGSDGLFWSHRLDELAEGTYTVISLIREPDREEAVLSIPGKPESVVPTHDGMTLCIADEAVEIFRRVGREWQQVCSRLTPVELASFLGDERLLAVMPVGSQWLEIWQVSEGLPTVAAIEVPGEVSCLSAREDRLVVGLRSGDLISLRIHMSSEN